MANIRKKANALIRQHHSRNPFEIIKGLNVILLFVPLKGVRGFYHYFQRNNIIYIDESLPEYEKLFVCAHELGHMLLHKNANMIFMDTHTMFNTDKYETEANKFAVDLLISDEILVEHQDCSIDQMSRILGYSEELLELRLK